MSAVGHFDQMRTSLSSSVCPQLRTYRCVALSDAKGQEETHAPQQNRSRFELLHRSGVQLVEQRLGLLQIERVEPLGKPPVDRSEQFVSLLRLALVAPEPRQRIG